MKRFAAKGFLLLLVQALALLCTRDGRKQQRWPRPEHRVDGCMPPNAHRNVLLECEELLYVLLFRQSMNNELRGTGVSITCYCPVQWRPTLWLQQLRLRGWTKDGHRCEDVRQDRACGLV